MDSFLSTLFEAIAAKMNEILSHQWGVWEVIGIMGVLTFGSRFIVQWIVSEYRGESVIPVAFWYLSIVGSLLLLSYAIHIGDPIVILGYLPNCLIYTRNLYFVYRKKNIIQESAE